MSRIEESIEIGVPVTTAYNQFTQFEDFPKFMEGVESVTQLDDTRLRWVADFIGFPVTSAGLFVSGGNMANMVCFLAARTEHAKRADWDLRAKGLSEWAVTRHVLKNSLPQVMAVMGLQFGYLLGGSILVETVFTWPGSGFLLSKAIINRDVPVLQGTILTLSLVFVATNLLVDLLQSLIDPRIRRG